MTSNIELPQDNSNLCGDEEALEGSQEPHGGDHDNAITSQSIEAKDSSATVKQCGVSL